VSILPPSVLRIKHLSGLSLLEGALGPGRHRLFRAHCPAKMAARLTILPLALSYLLVVAL
jgi:hypothetical protein